MICLLPRRSAFKPQEKVLSPSLNNKACLRDLVYSAARPGGKKVVEKNRETRYQQLMDAIHFVMVMNQAQGRSEETICIPITRGHLLPCFFMKDEILQNRRSLLVSSLLSRYRVEFISSGGDRENIQSYLAQNLVRKITAYFRRKVRVQLLDNRRGNFICCDALTEDQAKAHLYDNSRQRQEDEKLKWAALHLRTEIMKLPKSKTPCPANVQSLKACTPNIPHQLDLFSEPSFVEQPPL